MDKIDFIDVTDFVDATGKFSATSILPEKRQTSCELIIILFEYCNFACTFCPQDHDSKVGMSYDEIVAKADGIVEYINNNHFASDFVVRFIGGEPFNDEIIMNSNLLEAYTELTRRVRAETKLEGRPLDLIWITNLSIEESRPLVKKFMEEQGDDTELVVSYDPKGRFNATDLIKFKENIEIFRPHIRNVNSVMTKQNIDSILSGNEYYDYLYDNFDYSWDMYIKSNFTHDYAVPKESVVLKFYKLLADKYQRVEFIVPFLQPKGNVSITTALCSRGNGYAVDPTGTPVSEGCVGSHYLKKNGHPVMFEHNSEKDFLDNSVESFIDKYNCHSCEFYQRCPMMCFVGTKTGNMINDEDRCINKQLFEYIDAKPK
tara:strand:+ start:791 stop:1909 length:1119 start_codon:yes stop_codon:yes gene_type:complete